MNSAGLGEGNAVGVVSSRDESPRRHKPGVPTRPVGGGPREASIPVGPIQIRSTPARASKSEGGFSSPGNLACTSHGPTLIRTQRRPSHSRRGPGGAASSAAKRRQPQPLIRRAGRSHLREYRLAGVEPRTAGMSAHLIPYRVARRGSRRTPFPRMSPRFPLPRDDQRQATAISAFPSALPRRPAAQV